MRLKERKKDKERKREERRGRGKRKRIREKRRVTYVNTVYSYQWTSGTSSSSSSYNYTHTHTHTHTHILQYVFLPSLPTSLLFHHSLLSGCCLWYINRLLIGCLRHHHHFSPFACPDAVLHCGYGMFFGERGRCYP